MLALSSYDTSAIFKYNQASRHIADIKFKFEAISDLRSSSFAVKPVHGISRDRLVHDREKLFLFKNTTC
jgi:hypothetical protein